MFFAAVERRDRAVELTRTFDPDTLVTALSIPDEAWAERSQASLTAVRVGRIVVTPPWTRGSIKEVSDDDIVITVVPSMGFGTGHHASTRLCLQLVQPWCDGARSVLDVGTGSGVLAIAAWRLGAERVIGIDVDADALSSARENVDLNGAGRAVTLRMVDLSRASDEIHDRFDLVFANLTGAMLERFAAAFGSLLAPAGRLVVSGFQIDEEHRVRTAFETCALRAVGRAHEEQWIAFQFAHSGPPVGA